MRHHHLNHEEFSLAAMDDVIERGGRREWAELREAARADGDVAEKIRRICLARARQDDPQRHRLWLHYVDQRHPRVG